MEVPLPPPLLCKEIEVVTLSRQNRKASREPHIVVPEDSLVNPINLQLWAFCVRTYSSKSE